MVETIFIAQPSLFYPYFDFTLMNIYMNYVDKVKVLISRKSVDFESQF